MAEIKEGVAPPQEREAETPEKRLATRLAETLEYYKNSPLLNFEILNDPETDEEGEEIPDENLTVVSAEAPEDFLNKGEQMGYYGFDKVKIYDNKGRNLFAAFNEAQERITAMQRELEQSGTSETCPAQYHLNSIRSYVYCVASSIARIMVEDGVSKVDDVLSHRDREMLDTWGRELSRSTHELKSYLEAVNFGASAVLKAKK